MQVIPVLSKVNQEKEENSEALRDFPRRPMASLHSPSNNYHVKNSALTHVYVYLGKSLLSSCRCYVLCNKSRFYIMVTHALDP